MGLFPASLLMLSVANPEPADLGAKTTWIAQVPPGATATPTQLLLKTEKSGSPPGTRLLMCRVRLPVFVTVTVWAGLCVPTLWLPKLRPEGEIETIAGCTPVPETETDNGPLLESLPMVSVAEPGPAVRGANSI